MSTPGPWALAYHGEDSDLWRWTPSANLSLTGRQDGDHSTSLAPSASGLSTWNRDRDRAAAQRVTGKLTVPACDSAPEDTIALVLVHLMSPSQLFAIFVARK
jgi:hypothetical protein